MITKEDLAKAIDDAEIAYRSRGEGDPQVIAAYERVEKLTKAMSDEAKKSKAEKDKEDAKNPDNEDEPDPEDKNEPEETD